MLAASNMSRITLLKSSFSFGVSSHLVRGSLSFTSSSASIFSLFGFICGEDDSLANRPLIITAFPFGIQYFPVIHSKHIVSRGVTENRAPIPFLLGVGLK